MTHLPRSIVRAMLRQAGVFCIGAAFVIPLHLGTAAPAAPTPALPAGNTPAGNTPAGNTPAGNTPANGAPTDGHLMLLDQSAAVEPDGVFSARFDLAGLSLDGTITWSLYSPLGFEGSDAHERLVELLDGGRSGRLLQPAVTVPLLSLIDSSGTLTLQIPIRSTRGGSDRQFLPGPGVHPLEVVVNDGTGNETARTLLFLIRLPAKPLQPLRVAFLCTPPTQPTTSTDVGSPPPSQEENRGTLERVALLAELDGAAPISLALPIDNLWSLSESETSGDAELLRRLRNPQNGLRVIRTPYVPTFTGAPELHTAVSPDFGLDVSTGANRAAALGFAPLLSRVWAPDPFLGESALTALGDPAIGVDRVLVDPSQLTAPPTDDTAWTTVTNLTTASPDSAPTIAALPVDTQIGDRWSNAQVDPLEAGHRLLAELATLAFDGDKLSQQRAVVVKVGLDDPSIRRFQAVRPLLGTMPLITPTDAEGVFDGVTDNRSRTRLNPISSPAAALALRTFRAREQFNAWRVTVDESDPDIDEINDLLLAALDSRRSESERFDIVDNVDRYTRARFASIRLPERNVLTITSRRATVPVRVTNRSGFPVTVDLVLRTKRLRLLSGRVGSGDQGRSAESGGGLPNTANTFRVQLPQGDSTVELLVEARTSGDFPATVTLRSPDGSVALASTSFRVRSTAFSGVGVILSVISVVVLLVWWARDSLRRRHRRADGTPRTLQ